MTAGARLSEVAERHRFDEAKLAMWLDRHVDGFGNGMQVRQFVGGASNPTFMLSTDAGDYVLRKKPPGQLLASAHQVDREYRVMAALRDTDVPVPVMRALCDDPEIIGTSFYVMDYLEGRIFRDATLPGLTPSERSAIYDQLNATLAALHSVNYRAVGLEDYGRPTGYFERQVARWTKQYRGAETQPIPAMEALIAELPARIPAGEETSIAHGDYRLENVMFHPTEPRLIAVLDWELSTIGHPLADLGYNGFMWHSTSPSWGTLDGVDFATSGIPSEEEYVAAYCRRTGRGEIADWSFYLAFAVFRLASISQGVYARALAGVTPNAGEAINGTPMLAEQALALLHRDKVTG
ncbi:phosphotransferase family protein [Sphingomonas jeddahensis]|uniref:Putative aminoglycoside phosphotransferase n=1 Tax=Sphingomonas jeddahensis TaxID=1915074 RepID=A0A1V2EW24_9SPHN|nr:phosphotransferase family protein [Sphingomonas jeddahensis]ONF96369.1 putative aminoglycoside phosphotransferase [Sphingomonas jeddahensis]